MAADPAAVRGSSRLLPADLLTVPSRVQPAPRAPRPANCAADVGAQGGIWATDGVLDGNDFISFINLFFSNNYRADLGGVGGQAGSDGALNSNDFIAFVSAFFNGCP
ncbi:MAG: GC-type dockerin domain-anchored protein [Phycisphaerales bacterium]